jgi:hypothetical protein
MDVDVLVCAVTDAVGARRGVVARLEVDALVAAPDDVALAGGLDGGATELGQLEAPDGGGVDGDGDTAPLPTGDTSPASSSILRMPACKLSTLMPSVIRP